MYAYRCSQLTRDLLAIAKFLLHTPLHSTLQLGGFPSEYIGQCWKTGVATGRSKKFEDTYNRFDRRKQAQHNWNDGL